MAKKKQEVPKEETKAARFRRVIEPRVRKALKAIRLVGSVTGSTYEYDAEQIAHITAVLQDAVSKAVSGLEGKSDSRDGFSLGKDVSNL